MNQEEREANLAKETEYVKAAAAAITRLDMAATTLRRALGDEELGEEGEKLALTHIKATVEVVLERIDLCLEEHGWVARQFHPAASLAEAVEVTRAPRKQDIRNAMKDGEEIPGADLEEEVNPNIRWEK